MKVTTVREGVHQILATEREYQMLRDAFWHYRDDWKGQWDDAADGLIASQMARIMELDRPL